MNVQGFAALTSVYRSKYAYAGPRVASAKQGLVPQSNFCQLAQFLCIANVKGSGYDPSRVPFSGDEDVTVLRPLTAKNDDRGKDATPVRRCCHATTRALQTRLARSVARESL